VLAFPPEKSFAKRKAESDNARRAVTEAVRAITGRPYRLRYELRGDVAAAPAAEAAGLAPEEVVDRFVAEFDAEEIPDEEKD
jgi:DNA polymerase-3 subunit gamma/tau